ncbi:CrcB family protein [Clostridium tyrobutyricum]|uniref:fluoride efflux transporter FluC n=1 Tax=Clostridium tyrobutyricum TaxID=1519 RepID=UPI001C3944B6|nr:CrcB family protein [Clostridium tyrobutyricum]MBV4418461.1 CrcB family protein [Clostridium tyrobutyricum]
MKKYIYICAGGFLGTILRYFIESLKFHSYTGVIPINTLFINLTGSFLLAFITTILMDKLSRSSNIQLMICTGLIGAYTTFSTICKEIWSIFSKGYYLQAISYTLMSLMFGLVLSAVGVICARQIIKRISFRRELIK